MFAIFAIFTVYPRYSNVMVELLFLYVVFVFCTAYVGFCVPMWLVLSDLFYVACECVYADVCQTKLKFIVIQGTEGEI